MKYSSLVLLLLLILKISPSYAVVDGTSSFIPIIDPGIITPVIILPPPSPIPTPLISFPFDPISFSDGKFCAVPFPIETSQIDPHRSLLVHDDATLSAVGVDFSLNRTLTEMANQVSAQVPGTTAASIFQQMWDTQNESATAILPGNIHCDDNGTTINGYPQADCPRAEGQEAVSPAAHIDEYLPTALVNRIDLSHKGWKNCGEHRIIYGKRGSTYQGGFRKNLIIFEAVLPNPKPGCRSGCRDVIEFWANLSNDPDPANRAAMLEEFFYNGLPGYSPVVHVNHYNSSAQASFYGNSDSGQIRTNQFLQFPWLLKEFKTLTTCSSGSCDFDIVPISVKGNPYGVLWNKDIANGGPPFGALASQFQTETLKQVTDALLGHPDINRFSYAVSGRMNAADSVSQAGFANTQGVVNVDNYRTQLNNAVDPAFKNDLNAAGNNLDDQLTADQIANRAIALSCAGCHKPSAFGLTAMGAIGPGQFWPDALDFVHVDVDAINLTGMSGFNPVNFGGNPHGFEISPALLDEFLPTRNTHLVTEYNKKTCNCVPNFGRPVFIQPPFLDIQPITPIFAVKGTNELMAENGVIDPLRSEEDVRELFKTIDESGSGNLSKQEVNSNFQLKREIIKSVDESMMGELSQQAPQFSLQRSDETLEKVEISENEIKNLSPSEKSAAKIKIANDFDQAFPPRETVTGSFRTH